MTAQPRVALFIDAENTPAAHLPDILKRCRALGRITIARCYGGDAGLRNWAAAIAENHLMPIQTPGSAPKPNASDFWLTIDAVSLLHRGLFDHAVIASCDSDFTLLAMHIRDSGKGVDGIGAAKAAKRHQKAFDTFTIVPAAPEKKTPAAAPKPSTAAKAAALPKIDHLWLDEVFTSLSHGKASVELQSFARALAAKNKDYKKGYRTVQNYLSASGMFVIKDGQVARRVTPAPAASSGSAAPVRRG